MKRVKSWIVDLYLQSTDFFFPFFQAEAKILKILIFFKIPGPKLASSARLCGTEHCVSEKPLIFIVNHEYQRPKTYTHTVIPFSIVDPK